MIPWSGMTFFFPPVARHPFRLHQLNKPSRDGAQSSVGQSIPNSGLRDPKLLDACSSLGRRVRVKENGLQGRRGGKPDLGGLLCLSYLLGKKINSKKYRCIESEYSLGVVCFSGVW